MPTSPITTVFILLLLAISVLLAWIIRLEIKMNKLLSGKATNLDESIVNLTESCEESSKFRKQIEQYLQLVENRLRQSTQGIGTVRFNPFKTAGGGNQSFAVAFIDECGSGVVFSSLYSRDNVSVYAKPLEKYVSEFELTDEEKEAIEKAKAKLLRACL